MTPRSPKANSVLVQALGSGIRSTGNGLTDLPLLLRKVMEEEAWRAFVTPRGELVEHERFVDFVTTSPTAGLGATVELLRTIVAADEVTLDLLDRALQRPSHVHRDDDQGDVDNIHIRPSGTSKEAGLRRLRKDRPDLHADVLAGRLSTHSAMVKAGFRKRKISVPVSSAEDAAQAIKRNLEPEQVKELARLLAEDD
ncbi:hypothetical protein [Streptomyces sp. NPDC013489]|uniref:hypothetical protein n=1 Tax=Streptomyces sp. NPDC013489 TaxID=3155606 RepID=UPI0033E86D85